MQLSRTGNGHVDSSDSFVASLKGGGGRVWGGYGLPRTPLPSPLAHGTSKHYDLT